MATPYYGWILPVVGASADTWGGILNDMFEEMDAELASPGLTIKGNSTGATAASMDLTPAQAATIIAPVTGATQTIAGLKGLAPAPLATQQNRVLGGDGSWRAGLGRAFGCVLTSTDVVGSTPTLSGAVNVASVSAITDAGTRRMVTLTFESPLASTAFAVHVTMNKTSPNGHFTSYGAKTVNTVVVVWDIGPGGPTTEISVSGF